jgi:CBS-domain-containing membrane protein
MPLPRESLEPASRHDRTARQRLGWKQELVLALLPTVTVLIVLALVETFSQQRLLFASLASSAFLIYLDPQHGTNSARTLVTSQLGAAIIGFLCFWVLGAGYMAAATAMLATIALMIVFDVVHPPAVSTCLSFAFRSGSENNLLLFGLAVGLIVILLLLERTSLWILARLRSS